MFRRLKDFNESFYLPKREKSKGIAAAVVAHWLKFLGRRLVGWLTLGLGLPPAKSVRHHYKAHGSRRQGPEAAQLGKVPAGQASASPILTRSPGNSDIQL